MSVIQRILGSLEARLSQPRLSLWRTVYANFRLMSFKDAIKLPIYIYGRVKLFILAGDVEIGAPLRKGMIKFGKNTESFTCEDGSGFVQINHGCKLVFHGPAMIGVNSKIRLVGSNLTIGRNAFIASSVRIIGNGSDILIGDNCRIAFETVIMNSGFHYIYNSAKKGYQRTSRPICLGENNWVGNRTTISAGTVTKPFTIVGAGSFLNRDYTIFEGNYPMLGGRPAKLLTCGLKRVFSPITHASIERWFNSHPEHSFYPTEELEDNISDIDNEFK